LSPISLLEGACDRNNIEVVARAGHAAVLPLYLYDTVAKLASFPSPISKGIPVPSLIPSPDEFLRPYSDSTRR